jgi:hypothetical protein
MKRSSRDQVQQQRARLPPSQNAISEGADDGIRTHTPFSQERILSPLRLPFRHIGFAFE